MLRVVPPVANLQSFIVVDLKRGEGLKQYAEDVRVIGPSENG